MCEVLQASIESLGTLVATLDPAALNGVQAKEMVEEFAQVERLACAGRTLVAARLAETGAWANDGPFRDAGAWMASVTGSTVGRAKATLETSARLAELPATNTAFRAGELSEVQVDAIATAATADPKAEKFLLESAATEGVRGLKNACARVEAAASTDQKERHEKARAGRLLRHRRISDVEGLIEMRGPIEDTAAVMAALAPIEAELFAAARSSETREEPAALAFDAMVQMAADSAAAAHTANGNRAPATIVVRIDHTAFTRGWTTGGEICEIVGVGPIPASVAQRLCDDVFLKALITDGTNVMTISHLGRTIPARMRTALEELQPECVIAGCHTDRHLEIDHNEPVEHGGPTAIWNLNRFCHHHHDLKHRDNLRTEGEGTSKHFVPGPGPPPEP